MFRSDKNIYAQIIDDRKGVTLAAASSIEKDLKGKAGAARRRPPQRSANSSRERAQEAGVAEVVFDRGNYRYHGRVKALADGARENGLKF